MESTACTVCMARMQRYTEFRATHAAPTGLRATILFPTTTPVNGVGKRAGPFRKVPTFVI